MPDPSAGCRMFCLPYAGAGASIYRGWPSALRTTAEVWPVHLPGRERRLSERPIDTVQELATQTAKGIAGYLDRPFVLFGHSMGALISFELARALRRLGLRQPEALLVSGYGGPHLPDTRPPIHGLPDADFKQAVGALDGTPKDVFANAELMDLLLPLLRADFKLVETYTCRAEPPLDIPICVYAGEDDRDTPPDALEAWATCTNAPTSRTMFDGGHFYLRDHATALLDQVHRDVQTLTAHRRDQRQSARR
ncbi:alpha/beta fold hydrolase [uncultured Tateyamaria sp.]|uniref:thioesterase II family protein n=1 Tax=uncultured Tateyamaria sp. TaxID=455651 RepID=UPI002624F9BD|nr:alpha/beta fold hydrolase [uncultured Tateyamaria sp.]